MVAAGTAGQLKRGGPRPVPEWAAHGERNLGRVRRRTVMAGGLAGLLALLGACSDGPQAEYSPELSAAAAGASRVYRVGIHPLHNPQRLLEIYGPILDAISVALPDADLQLEASRNYEEFEKKLYGGQFDFALPNPYQTVLAQRRGYRVVAKMADDREFRGLILVRRDSEIRSVHDLKGQAVAYPAATALAATLLPQQYLQAQGLDVQHDISNVYVGSQESAILNVLRGHVAAAGTWTVPWRAFQVEQPAQAAQLEVRWQTAPLVNNSWVARADLPPELVQRFVQQLSGLHQREEGRQLLARVPVSAFEPASDASYRPVQAFLDQFDRQVRPIEH